MNTAVVVPMKRPEFDQLMAECFRLLGVRFDTRAARVMMWAIGRQESRMFYRRQVGGPARGLWQFEKGGGVRGILTHGSSASHMVRVCDALDIKPTMAAVYGNLATNDLLAACCARLLLFTDREALPQPVLNNAQSAWDYYFRNWRPGKPHRHTWDAFWKEAVEMHA